MLTDSQTMHPRSATIYSTNLSATFTLHYFLLFLLFILPLSSHGLDLPTGWRLADKTELAKPKLRSASINGYTEVDADFNGDGIIDKAVIVKSEEYSGEGLLVYLSTAEGYQWQVLERIHWGDDYPNVSLVMGIELAETGNYQTACGQGQWVCDEYETAEFAVEHPGIWYFRLGEHKSLFYWNNEKQEFDKQWISN